LHILNIVRVELLKVKGFMMFFSYDMGQVFLMEMTAFI